ncbi:Hypothetical protein D9617_2g054630 [Elsinoe fawcettii]|nr:Hypothetical protein D9617_2g054630 [Elsinoe fawcettii]
MAAWSLSRPSVTLSTLDFSPSLLSLPTPSNYAQQLPPITDQIYSPSTYDSSQSAYSRQSPLQHAGFINPFNTSPSHFRTCSSESIFRSGTSSTNSVPGSRSYTRPFPENSLAASGFNARTPRTESIAPDRSRWQNTNAIGAMQRDERSMTSPRADSPQDKPAIDLPWKGFTDFTGGALRNERHEIVHPVLYARIEKGINWIDDEWTGYRRNYVVPSTAYTLEPHSHGQALYLHSRRIQALSMKVSAVAEDPNHPGGFGKPIELIQFTAKRDHGARRSVTNVKVAPGLPLNPDGSNGGAALQQYMAPHSTYNELPAHYLPALPLQVEDDDSDPAFRTNREQSHRYTPDYSPLVAHGAGDGICRQHCFDRLQFKSATTNNGKRRAAQQYFFLKVELWADTRLDSNCDPNWELLSHLVSDRLVIRGRSPNHYDPKNITRSPQPPKEDDDDKYKKSPTLSPPANQVGPYSRTYYGGGVPPGDTPGYNSGSWRQFPAAVESASPEDLNSPLTDSTGERNDHRIYQHGLGDDLLSEVYRSRTDRAFFHAASPEPGYIYDAGPLYQNVPSSLKTEEGFDDPYQHTAAHDQFPRSMAGMEMREQQEFFGGHILTESSLGFYPTEITNDESP